MLQELTKDVTVFAEVSDELPPWAKADASLSKAKGFLTRGDGQYRQALAALQTARAADPGRMTNRFIAKQIGRSHRWVNTLMSWNGFGTPFEKRSKQIYGDGMISLNEPTIFLREGDVIVMGDHVLVYGDAECARSKLDVMAHAGLPYLKEFFDPDAIEDEGKGFVVACDPPYGVGKDEIFNDHRAEWGSVYKMFNPRGGFAFAAYKAPQFFKAQKSIEDAGWEVKHYLGMQNAGGQPWDGRVQNSMDAIFFFEREGEDVWPKRDTGSISPSLLKPSAGWTKQRKELAGTHKTPKPVNVMADLINLITEPGDVVLDPFTGSGSTLMACEATGRRFIGIEIVGEHVQHTVRRWQLPVWSPDHRQAIVHRDFAEPIAFDDLEKNPDHGNDLYVTGDGENAEYHYR